MFMEKILTQLANILGKRKEEVKALIEEIKSRYKVNDNVAILDIISQHNLADRVADIVKLLKIHQTLIRIKHIRSGVRGISVLGIIESIRIFERGPNLALVLLTDDSGTAQVYVLREFPEADTISKISIGSIIALENVKCSGILSNGQPRLMVTRSSSVLPIDRKTAEELIDSRLPDIKIYDVQDVLRGTIADGSYLHMSAIYMGEIKNEHSKYEKRILLGSINDFCRTKIRCILRSNAINEFERVQAKPGDIIEAHCLLVRKFNDVRYVVARNLTAFIRKTPEFTPSTTVGNRGWWKYSLTATSPPRFGTYEKNGQTRRYAAISGALPDGTEARVLVWSEDFLEQLIKLTARGKFMVFGILEFSGDQLKIHVPEKGGYLEVTSELPLEETTARQLITNFQALNPNTYVDLICKIINAEEVKSERLYGILRLTDGTKILKMLVWNHKVFEKAKGCLNALVKITNIRAEYSREGERELVLLSTQLTEFDKIASDFEYTRVPLNAEIKKVKPLASLNPSEQSCIVGTITEVEWVGKMSFCKKCGGLIVDPTKRICEMGHIGSSDEKDVVSTTIDDGFFERDSVIIPILELKKSGILQDLSGFRQLPQLLLGREVCLLGRLKIELSTGVPKRLFLVDQICELEWLLIPED